MTTEDHQHRVPAAALTVAAIVVGVGAHLLVSSPLWLDEALSVSIAGSSVTDLPDALRRDGHPGLYYVLLGGWMSVFGDGDASVRALSGLFGLAATLVIADIARRRDGARTGITALALGACLPWMVRYGAEARMYALVVLLVAAAWWFAERHIDSSNRWSLAAVAVSTAALLHTHYWALFLGAGTVAVLALAGRLELIPARRALELIGALAVGALAFLPWLPVLAHQAAHTGTPWATLSNPLAVVAITVADLGGGPYPESVVLGWLVAGLVLVALLLQRRHLDSGGLELVGTGRAVAGVRAPLAVAALTMGVAVAIGIATSAAYQSRYAAVIIPFVIVAAAVGIGRLPDRAGLVVLAVIVALSGSANWRMTQRLRTNAGVVSERIASEYEPGDLVVVCPDQIGPDLQREADGRFSVVAYPDLSDATRVDWTDYAERQAGGDPAQLADELMASVQPSGSVWFVWWPDYRTLNGACEDLLVALAEDHERDHLIDPVEGQGVPSYLDRFSADAPKGP